MRDFKKLFVWQNKARLNKLTRFRNNYINYLNAVYEGNEASGFRTEVNFSVPAVGRYMLDSGNYPMVNYTDAPIAGGRRQRIDLLENLFNLDGYAISPEMMIDSIERSIGVYSENAVRSLINTINPFHYLGLLISLLSSLPFRFFSRVGFNGAKAESSILGRIIKGVIELAVFIAALIAIIQFLEASESVKSYIYNLINFAKEYFK